MTRTTNNELEKFRLNFSRCSNHEAAMIEQFSFECRKVIGFAFTTLRDWLKRFAPLLHPIRSKTKTNCDMTRSHAFSSALRQLHVITSSFDWFIVLSVFFVTG